jgi:outer membrane lipoprotein SlyB
MKTLLVSGLALLTATALPAQIIRPEAVNGAVLGGIAGAVIGNNSGDLHHNAWRGAAYGAGAGLILGSVIGEANEQRYGHQVPVPPRPRTYVYREAPGYYSPNVVYTDADYGYSSYAVEDERPNYAGRGLLLGGIAGAIIGNNSGDLHHNAWRGAAYGAAAGYILGSIAENNARRREAALTRVVVNPAPVTYAAPAPAAPVVATPPPAPPSPMASANSLFGRP